jgi:hypothetical protein
MDSEQANRLFDETEIVLVIDRDTRFNLQSQIASCENCNPDGGEASVSMILDAITHSDPTRTSYFFGMPLRCPKCAEPIAEDGLVEWEWKGGREENGR